jgi:hypothetical protein
MKLSIFFSTAILLPALVAQAQQNNTWRFKLWATTIKGENPHMSGFVDIDTEGVVGFNRTGEKYFPGFVAVCLPSFLSS